MISWLVETSIVIESWIDLCKFKQLAMLHHYNPFKGIMHPRYSNAKHLWLLRDSIN